jgi:hypothetical protein
VLDGGVRIRGPLGIHRRARTTLVSTEPPALIRGRAELGRTVGHVTWTLQPAGGGTRVTLDATVERAWAGDRLLLRLGGRRWLRRRFERVLETLERQLAR